MRMLGRVVGENIEVKVLPAPDLGRVTMADPSQVAQILINLVVNARDAMPDGGLLTIETRNVEVDSVTFGQHLDAPPGAYVMLGCDRQRHRHRPGDTSPASSSRSSRPRPRDAARVWGSRRCTASWPRAAAPSRSTASRGTAAPSSVYFRQLAEPVARRPRGSRTSPNELGGKETVLVVEDEDAVREFAARALRQYGYSVLVARRAQEALLIAAEHPGTIDVVLADVIMPHTSGPGLMTKLHELRPASRVVFMSGFSENALGHHGVLESNHPFLQKPFSPETLARKIREALASGAATSD